MYQYELQDYRNEEIRNYLLHKTSLCKKCVVGYMATYVFGKQMIGESAEGKWKPNRGVSERLSWFSIFLLPFLLFLFLFFIYLFYFNFLFLFFIFNYIFIAFIPI